MGTGHIYTLYVLCDIFQLLTPKENCARATHGSEGSAYVVMYGVSMHIIAMFSWRLIFILESIRQAISMCILDYTAVYLSMHVTA